MSNWTMEEVSMLDEANGGGNRAAAARWLARVPEAARPKPDSNQEVLKQFIDQAYNKHVWAGAPQSKEATVAPPSVASPCPVQTNAPVSQVSNPRPVESVDLLDTAFDAAPQGPAGRPVAPPVVNGDLLDNDFFGSVAAPAHPAASSGTSSAFPFTLAAQMIAEVQVPSQGLSGAQGFDPFANGSQQQAACQQQWPQQQHQEQQFPQQQQQLQQWQLQQQLQQQQQQQFQSQQQFYHQQQPFHHQQQPQQQMPFMQQPYQQPHQQSLGSMAAPPWTSASQPQLPASACFAPTAATFASLDGAGLFAGLTPARPTLPFAGTPSAMPTNAFAPSFSPTQSSQSSPSNGLMDMFDPFAPVVAA